MGRTEDGTSAAIGGQADKVQGEHPGAVLPSRLETGNSSNPGGCNGEWRDDGFNGQNFGGFEEGYFEGHNGYGNGYGSMNRGNFRQRLYRQQWNRGYNNSFRGGNNRFNGGGNRYQRRFNNNENPMTFPAAKSAATTQMVASASGETEGSLGMQNMDTSSVDHLVNPSSSRAQKKLDKVLCLRCGENGHFSDSCSAALCLYCEKTSHASKDCPLLSMPKPVDVTYGVSRSELMFHEVPASSDVTFKDDSGKVGKISVTGGCLEPQEIVKELEWIIPGNHQWDLRPTEDGAFKALFPSKADLAHMTKIINVLVPETSMFLHFKEWSAADLDRFYFSQVWVRVHGCCYKERCDYLSLFAVGSLIGKTKEVDMEFTRAHTMVRMKVEVTRVELIPTTTVDHTYDGEGYGLIFKVEGDQGKGKVDAVMHDANPDDDSENKDKVKEAPKGVDTNSGITKPTAAPNPIQPKTNNVPPKVMDLAPRRLWGDSDNDDEDSLPSPLPCFYLQSVDTKTKSPSVSVDFQIAVSISENAAVRSENFELSPTAAGFSGSVKLAAGVGSVTEKQTAYAAAEIPEASLATVFVPEETQLPMTPQNAPNVGQPPHKTHCFDTRNTCIPCIDDKERVSPPKNISLTSVSILPNSDYMFSSTIQGPGSGQHVFTPVLSQGGDSKLGTGVFLGGRCSVEDVVNFGGIPSPSLNACSSERIRNQGNADATQLERAKCLAKAKDAALSPDNVCSALLGLICSPLGVTQGKIVEGDPELIDDSEFYHQLLKEFLESCDGASESAFYALRKKQQKRKLVDRRASKSRKIRYNVHEKLANFMAPVPITVPPMASKLFENLFGMGNQKATAA
ncbi:hypothetical protein ACQ4PT_044819 [Festuca glaucescens]